MNVRSRENLEAGTSDSAGQTEELAALRERVAELEATAASQAAALLDAEARYRALVEAAPINVFHKDAGGRFIFGNQRFCESLGRPWDEIAGRTDFDFFPRKLAQKYRRDDLRVMETGQSWHDVEEHLSPEGEKRYVETSKTPLYDASGRLVGIQGLFRDITAQRGAELALGDSEARYRSLVESLPLSTWSKGLDGRFTFANQMFCERAGLKLEELIGRTDLDLFREELAEKYRRDDEHVVQSGKVLEAIEEFRQPEGNKLYVQVLKAPVHDAAGRIVGTQGVFWDVTARVEAEAQVERARLAAEEASRAKSQFLANMSHEIRTPLGGILGMTHLMLESEPTPLQREYLGLVEQSAEALLTVINDILDFSKIEAGKLELVEEVFSPVHLVRGLVQLLEPRARQKGLALAANLATDTPARVRGDAGRLRQVLLNLLGNAVKFTERGEVELSLEVEGRDERTVELHLAVRDTGIGIPPDKQQRVFESFEQADGATNRKYGGTGLGLAISQRLVELMHGRIWLESEVGRGSTFHVCLPLALEAGGELAPAAAPREIPPPVRPLRILLAEDSLVNQKYAVALLGKRGHEVVVAADGRQAVNRALAERFDVVLMDVQMPELDGLAATAEIRRYEREIGGHLPIVAMTAHAMQGDRERCLAAGMDGYVSKPLRPEEFLPAAERAAEGLEALAPTAAAAPAAAPSEDLVDWARARARVAGDEDLLAELIDVFLVEFPRSRELLQQAADSGQAPVVGRISHTLKSSFGHFGAGQAAEAAQRLESAGYAGTLTNSQQFLDQLDSAARQVLPVLESFVQQRRSEAARSAQP
ncbi:MAG: PAS domain-containing protein [Pirellulales bacterium]